MPQVSELNLPRPFAPEKDRKASHEDYTLKSVVDSSFTESFSEVKKRFGVDPIQVAGLIIGEPSDEAYFTIENTIIFLFCINSCPVKWTVIEWTTCFATLTSAE